MAGSSSLIILDSNKIGWNRSYLDSIISRFSLFICCYSLTLHFLTRKLFFEAAVSLDNLDEEALDKMGLEYWWLLSFSRYCFICCWLSAGTNTKILWFWWWRTSTVKGLLGFYCRNCNYWRVFSLLKLERDVYYTILIWDDVLGGSSLESRFCIFPKWERVSKSWYFIIFYILCFYHHYLIISNNSK